MKKACAFIYDVIVNFILDLLTAIRSFLYGFMLVSISVFLLGGLFYVFLFIKKTIF